MGFTLSQETGRCIIIRQMLHTAIRIFDDRVWRNAFCGSNAALTSMPLRVGAASCQDAALCCGQFKVPLLTRCGLPLIALVISRVTADGLNSFAALIERGVNRALQ